MKITPKELKQAIDDKSASLRIEAEAFGGSVPPNKSMEKCMELMFEIDELLDWMSRILVSTKILISGEEYSINQAMYRAKTIEKMAGMWLKSSHKARTERYAILMNSLVSIVGHLMIAEDTPVEIDINPAILKGTSMQYIADEQEL